MGSFITMGGVCSAPGCVRSAYKILVGKSEATRPLARPGYNWKKNIKMSVRQIGWEDVDWIHLAQDRDR
jgi:hypothetical protein